MEMQIRNGTEIINLSSGIVLPQPWVPTHPEPKGSDSPDSTLNGGRRFSTVWANVIEVVKLVYFGTEADLATFKRKVASAFHAASIEQASSNPRPVYFEVKLYADSEWWRSEIAFGVVDVLASSLSSPHGLKQSSLILTFKRSYYWETVEERSLPLTNSAGTDVSTGLALYSTSNPSVSHDIYCTVGKEDIEGDIPAPLRISYKHNEVGLLSTYLFYMHVNRSANPLTNTCILQGESSVNNAGTSVLPASPDYTNYSGGQYRYATWTGDTEVTVFGWDDIATLFRLCDSKRYKVIMIAAGYSSSAQIRFRIQHFNLTTVWTGPWIDLPATPRVLNELGQIQLPPYRSLGNDPSALSLEMEARKTGGGNIAVDYLIFLPLDDYSLLIQKGYGITADGYIYDDNLAQQAYGLGLTAVETHIWNRKGTRIMIHPGKDHRFFSIITSGYTPYKNVAWSVQMKYRPRRLTI